MSEKRIQRFIEEACLMDDLMFELFFREDPKYIEIVIREIFKQLNLPFVKIVSVETQFNLKTIGGCDPRLDLLAEDEEGRRINIEVQRALRPDHPMRGRYYSAVLDTNSLPKGATYKDLLQNYVIFIMAKDFRERGKPAYLVQRVYMDTKELYNDGSTIIYLNGEYRGDDPIGRLMNDFNSKRAETMKNKELAERMSFFKETPIGRRELSDLETEIYSEDMEKSREEGREEGRQDVILSMFRNGMSCQLIAKICGYPEQRIDELRVGFIEKGLLPA